MAEVWARALQPERGEVNAREEGAWGRYALTSRKLPGEREVALGWAQFPLLHGPRPAREGGQFGGRQTGLSP